MLRLLSMACLAAVLAIAPGARADEDAALADAMIEPLQDAPHARGPQDVWWGNRSVAHDNHIRFERVSSDCAGICERCDTNMICCDTGCPCVSCQYVCDDCDNCPPMIFDKIFFDLDRSFLRPDALVECQRILAFLRANPDKRVLIEGHTCDLATPVYNMGLGQRRANAVRDWLIGQGIAPERLQVKSFGEHHPWVGVSERELNRRAIVTLLN